MAKTSSAQIGGASGLSREFRRRLLTCVDSTVVSIAAFQAVDPGSNPGWRSTFVKITFLPLSSIRKNRKIRALFARGRVYSS